MFGHFTHAIARKPGHSYANGITAAQLGKPDLNKALAQHAAYCDALRSLGLEVTVLEADEDYPDGCFVEDTAVVTPRGAIITRPGAASRAGETHAIERALKAHFNQIERIESPGCVDGGDICETDSAFLIGISHRTNPHGAQQLQHVLADLGYPSNLIDITSVAHLLHFKTGISALGFGRLASAPGLPDFESLRGFEKIILKPEEQYGANCIVVNGTVIIPTGCPDFQRQLTEKGYATLALEMSEFQKMDGGLSCLSLRF